jgi:hypothetical protein
MTMKKSPLRVTKKDSFAMGRVEGAKDAFEEILTYLNGYPEETPGVSSVRAHIRSRLRYLLTTDLTDAFKQRDLK